MPLLCVIYYQSLQIYDAIWQEGYHAKVERENREKDMRGGLSEQVQQTLDEQVGSLSGAYTDDINYLSSCFFC